MGKLIKFNSLSVHTSDNEAAIKTMWSFNDHLPARLKERKLKRGDWCSFVVMEFVKGTGTSVCTRHTDKAAAEAAHLNDVAVWSVKPEYVGAGLCQLK